MNKFVQARRYVESRVIVRRARENVSSCQNGTLQTEWYVECQEATVNGEMVGYHVYMLSFHHAQRRICGASGVSCYVWPAGNVARRLEGVAARSP